jgi:hypothetical protein
MASAEDAGITAYYDLTPVHCWTLHDGVLCGVVPLPMHVMMLSAGNNGDTEPGEAVAEPTS